MYNKPRIYIELNKIDIVNFTTIQHFDETNIILKINDKSVIIKGKNLVISKLVVDEVLIEGMIDKIEFR